jgi:DHA1 family multidrug resistance protein-like MFS transporter
MINWKRNLVFIWLSQFLALAGFTFSMPFIPFYIQELGITDPVELKKWVAIFAAGAPLSLAVFSPIWGMLADKYGRRLMMLRANFAGAVVLTLMGLASNVHHLILLRVCQGMFTGTMTAAQTFVSVHTPKNRSGLALGALSSAVFSGAMFGSFIGGIFADAFGYRQAFYVSGILLLLGGMLVLFGAREQFIRPESDEPNGSEPNPFRSLATQIRPSLPILILIMSIAFVRQFDKPFLPILVQDIHGSIQGASSWTGSLSAVCCVAGLLAGFIIGRWADIIPPPKIGQFSSLAAAAFMVPQGLASGFPLLFASRFGMVFFAGGLDPVFQIWLSKVTPSHQRGTIFGWAATAKSIGWIIAPLASGMVASLYNIRAIYFTGAGLFLLLIPLIWFVVRYIRTT